MRLSRTIPPILYALPLLFLGIFFFYPLARILGVSFGADGSLTLAAIGETLSQPFFWRVLWFTTWQAAASTGLTLILGLPLAYVFARYAFPGKALLRALTTIPFVMPTVVVAVAFTALLGENGLLNDWLQAGLGLDGPPIRLMNTVWIILIAHAFYNVSVVLRTVGSFWANLNPRLEEAAAVLGAGPGRLFWEITLPLLMPSIIAAGLLVFLFCFTSFGVVLILGGLGFATLEVEIYRQAVSYFNLPVAGFLALVQMALTFAVMAVYTRMQSRASLPVEMRPQSITARRASTARERLFVGLSLAAMLVILLSPLLALAWRSVTLGGDGLTFAYFRALADNPRNSAFFVPPLEAVRNSLLYAGATVVLSLFLGVISAYLLARRRSRISAILDPIFLAAPGHLRRDLGLWLHHRNGQSAHIVDPGPHRPHAHRHPLCRAHPPPRPARAGPTSAGGGAGAWGPIPCGCGGRWMCPCCGGPCSWARSSPSPSAWGSLGPPCSSPGPTCPPCPW